MQNDAITVIEYCVDRIIVIIGFAKELQSGGDDKLEVKKSAQKKGIFL